MAFRFLDPGPMIDGELELVVPAAQWVDALLAAAHHPLTVQEEPKEAELTRSRVMEFLKLAPLGRQYVEGGGGSGKVPTYYFWMRVADESPGGGAIGGGIGLRIGMTTEVELFSGHIGYHVYPPARGRHYAERSCRLLLPLARRHGLTTIWITCNPDNIASRRTCERLGARLVERVKIPESHEFFARGEREKCRYRIDLDHVKPA